MQYISQVIKKKTEQNNVGTSDMKNSVIKKVEQVAERPESKYMGG